MCPRDWISAPKTKLLNSIFSLIHKFLINIDIFAFVAICFAKLIYRKAIEVQEQRYKNNTDGRFDAEAIAVLEADKIQLPTTFRCEVSIPEANYTSVKEYVYNGNNKRFLGELRFCTMIERNINVVISDCPKLISIFFVLWEFLQKKRM